MFGADFAIDQASETRLVARFASFTPRLIQRLTQRLRPVQGHLLAAVKSRVPKRSGKLLSEVASFLDANDQRVRVRVRVLADPSMGRTSRGLSSIGKAAAIEYGARGTVQVRAHSMTLAHAWAYAVAPQKVSIGAYQRRINIPARRYLREPFATVAPEGRSAIQASVSETVKA